MRRPGANRRAIRGFGQPALSSELSLEDLILAQIAAAGWDGAVFPLTSAYLTLGAGDRASVFENVLTGGNATQGTDAARPTYSATAVNGKEGCTFDGGDAMLTASIDTGAATAYAIICLFSDTDGASKFQVGFGGISGEAMLLNTNASGAGNLDIYADGTGGAGATTSRARSTTSFPMTVPAVVTGTWDSALATNETEIRHAGVNVTSTRPNNGNNPDGLGSQVLTIGARETPATGNFSGAMAYAILMWGSTAIPLTEIAEIESLLGTEWGV